MKTLYDFKVEKTDGTEQDLKEYEGKVVLVVNTASKCGFAPQFEGLEHLYQAYKDEGFVVLGFPCGQFQNQEYDDIDKTIEFCQMNYGVSFPMFAKVDVNGPDESPLYTFLKNQEKGFLSDKIKWNFTKFLVDSKGNVVERYAPTTDPINIEKDIQKLL